MGLNDRGESEHVDKRSGGLEGLQEQISTPTQAQPRDQARVDHLKDSIVRVQEQIDKTRKELNHVCEQLRANETYSKGGLNPLSTAVSRPATVNAQMDPDTSPDHKPVSLSNEHVVEMARNTVNGHIRMLTKYNELKDVAMSMFKLIAEHKGVRVGEVLRKEGVELDD